MTQFIPSPMTAVLIGHESLLVQCAEIWRAAGHRIKAIVTHSNDIGTWAADHDISVINADSDLAKTLDDIDFEWLLSIANLDMLDKDVLALPQKGAVNFHDGPLPRYAGLNAPVWARIAQETRHGITWHTITNGVDKGDILVQRDFEIALEDTALTLNTKCYAAAIDSFSEVITSLQSDAKGTSQDLSRRSYFGRAKRPDAAARLDFKKDAADIVALVRALDHGDYWNPLSCPKIVAAGQVMTVGNAKIAPASSAHGVPGTVLATTTKNVTVACGRGSVILGGLRAFNGQDATPTHIIREGEHLATLDKFGTTHLTNTMKAATPNGEAYWRKHLPHMSAVRLPLLGAPNDIPDYRRHKIQIPKGHSTEALIAAIGVWAHRSGAHHSFDFVYRGADQTTAPGYLSDWLPLRMTVGSERFSDVAQNVATQRTIVDQAGVYACDLVQRDAHIPMITTPDIGISLDDDAAPIKGTCLTFSLGCDAESLVDTLFVHCDMTRIDEAHLARLLMRFDTLAAALANPDALSSNVADFPILPEVERHEIITQWNKTSTPFDPDLCMHHQFEHQAARTPDATAVIFQTQSLSYAALNNRANQTANVLREMGVGQGSLVGLFCHRSLDMMVAALGILKAGAAYVPLDPAYPADRIAHYISDSGAAVLVTQTDLMSDLPKHRAQVLELDSDQRIANAAMTAPDVSTKGDDLAYVIYTSGSTGVPKGVMVEHSNVANFFVGMDAKVAHDPAGVWMALTSLSFDISVLELFYSLARGFKLVISGDENQTQISGGRLPGSDQGMEFSLYYWGNDDTPGPKKYELLLEGAKYADENGFCAVWTPERHFHAFGGPYPNPSVTGAAVAAVTKNIGVRAGSCVAPLHHTARLAEEWAVIDNLTAGRAGLAIASGWQPDDFVLRPENTPPKNRESMFDSMRDLRALWRGETVDFPRKDGSMFGVRTQPRPVSKELDLWVTTAGNPETWKDAGRHGAHILTHLLGQSVEEVAEKIGLYHAELRAAGHNPDDFKVTLMLHTFVHEDRDTAREIAREPMKDYLRSAAGLIKQYAWAFPAFKRPTNVKNAFELDLGVLDDDELEAILDFAFLRYFEDSGLFGTVQDCLDRVEQLKRIGVSEIACLIDYGIETQVVLDSLRPLTEVLRQSNAGNGLAVDDTSIAAQVIRHKVSHLQCTPSMARMLTMNDEARFALGQVDHLMIGGEALSGSLVAELNATTRASIQNMYGPTETTIWSSTANADASEGMVNIGAPIANTQLYVLDEMRTPVPVGVSGELYIGGAGVTRGYWQRPEMTTDRFVANPFGGAGKLYRTGDLVRWRTDGQIDFLGRVDHQVKLRGYRIELGEIETVLEGLASVSQAVVVAREDTPGDTRLVAYLQGGDTLSEDKLRTQLSKRLPDYMVPSHFVVLDDFPLTPNKKVDRKALPAPDKNRTRAQRVGAVVPEGGAAQTIADIWSRILGVSDISAKDNFFDLGGHSLLAVQAHREIRDLLKTTTLSITDIFRFPVLSDLVVRVEGLSDTPTGATPRSVKAVVPDEAQHSKSDAMAKRRAMRARRRVS